MPGKEGKGPSDTTETEQLTPKGNLPRETGTL